MTDRRPSGAAGSRIRELPTAGDPSFSPAHRLLRGEFPHAEMMPVLAWRNAMRERREGLWTDLSWHLLVAERGPELLAASTGSYLGNVNVGIIGYIAVRPAARSLGMGPRMRRALRRKFDADARQAGHPKLAALVGEVSYDNKWLKNLVRHEKAIALDFPYFQPSLGGKHEAVPFVLYYQPLDGERQSIGVAELRRLLYTMWRRMYRIPSPLSHPEFRLMLRSLKGRRRIGQLNLDR